MYARSILHPRTGTEAREEEREARDVWQEDLVLEVERVPLLGRLGLGQTLDLSKDTLRHVGYGYDDELINRVGGGLLVLLGGRRV